MELFFSPALLPFPSDLLGRPLMTTKKLIISLSPLHLFLDDFRAKKIWLNSDIKCIVVVDFERGI